MKIAIASDLSGLELKEAIVKHLIELGHDVSDLGTKSADAPMPFIKAAPPVAEAIQKGEAERGILICGTGMGMSQVANKFKGVRAACVESVYAARMCRAINDSNVMCMGGWIIAPTMGIVMADAFVQTDFTQDLEDWRAKNLRGFKEQLLALEEEKFQ